MNQWKRKIMQPETASKPKGLSGAKVAKAAELVNYQDGSIVSREIVKKPTGNVTIFAFDEGQGLSEHTAPFDALVQVVEGETEIMISGQPHRLQGGEMILMPAGQPHALKALKRFKMILTMIRS
jgi:quercetin dioxygenase-like cupin family protein